VRGLIGVIEILMTLGVVACIASLVSARGRRLGDVFAGTLVVRERGPAARSGYVPPPPPWLAGRFQGLDLSAVPDGLWLAVRQYLTRMGQLDPQVGSAMAQRLASDLADRTGTPVPPGVHPAAYLAAVLQERQAREARRAFGNGAAAGGRPGGMAAGPTGPPAPAPGPGGCPAPMQSPYAPPAPAQGPYGQPGYPAAASAPAAPSPTPPTPPPAISPSPSPTPPPSATPPAPSSPEPKDRPSAGGSRGGFVPPA